MEKSFLISDIEKLYDAFIKTCDYIEEENGCGKCPLWNEICGSNDKSKIDEFSKALARIRETTGIKR